MMKVRTEMLQAALFFTVATAGVAHASQDIALRKGPPTASSFDCKTAAIAVTSSDSVSTTDATAYSDVTDGAVTFKQKKSGCIVVHFRGENSAFFGQLLVRALLDGAAMFPIETILGQGGVSPGSNAASWVGVVDAGNHTVQVQFRSGVNGFDVSISKHTLEVAHK